MSLSRVIVFGKDIDGLKNFYQSNFKLTVVEEVKGEWVVFNAGAIEIAFHCIGNDYVNEGTFRVENNIKLVFSIEKDITGFRDTLIRNGVNMKEIQWFQYCDVEDLEGNVFQLHQKNI